MTELVAPSTAFAAKSDTPGTTVSATPTVGLPSFGAGFKTFLVQIENNGSDNTEAKADYDIDHLVAPASVAITAVLPGISVHRMASTPSRHNWDKERCNNRNGDDQKTDAEPNENIGHLIHTTAAVATTTIPERAVAAAGHDVQSAPRRLDISLAIRRMASAASQDDRDKERNDNRERDDQKTDAKTDQNVGHLVSPSASRTITRVANVATVVVLSNPRPFTRLGIGVCLLDASDPVMARKRARKNDHSHKDQEAETKPDQNVDHLVTTPITSTAVAKTAIALNRRAVRLLISMESLPVQENDKGDNRNERDFKKPVQVRPPNPQYLSAARKGVSQ